MAARNPTLLQRINGLRAEGVINEKQFKVLRAIDRETKEGIKTVAAGLELTVSDLLSTKSEFIACRSMRHYWEVAEFTWDYRPYGVPEVQRCERCSMVRIKVYTLDGRPNGTRYIQPAGYSINGAGRRLTSGDFDIIRRFLMLADMVAKLESDPDFAEAEELRSREQLLLPV